MLRSLFLCVIVTVWTPADAQNSGRYVVGCPARCDKALCPRLPADCPAGQTLDVCHCCPVCASAEGEACSNGGKLGDPVCEEGLECSVSGGVQHTATVRRRSKSGICVCKSPEPVCGSDGVSYRNICELKRVSRRAQKLQQPPVLFIQRGACGKGECKREKKPPKLKLLILISDDARRWRIFSKQSACVLDNKSHIQADLPLVPASQISSIFFSLSS